MRWRRSCQEISDLFLEIPTQCKIHNPTLIRRPVPIQHVLACRFTAPVPIPFYCAEQTVDPIDQIVARRVGRDQILPEGDQALHQEGSFHKIASVIIGAKWNYFTGTAIDPMAPGAVKAVCRFKEAYYFFESRNSFST